MNSEEPENPKEEESNSEDSHMNEDEEDIQNQLDRLLGTDSDSDKSYLPSDTGQSDKDEGDDEDSDIEYFRKLVNEKKQKVMKEVKKMTSPGTPKVTKVKGCSQLYIREMLYLSNLKKTREIIENPIRFSKVKKLLTEEIISILPDENTESCCQILIELMSLPSDFWNVPRSLNVEREDLGLVTLEVLQRMITNRTLFLETVGIVGKIGMAWRRSHIEPGPKPIKPREPRIPKTFLKCCELLISAGDWPGLKDMFGEHHPVKGEMDTEAGLMRCVVEMILAKTEEELDIVSQGEGSSHKTGASNLLPSTIIDTLSSAVREPGKRVEWFMPLLCDFIENKAQVRDLLTQYRDINMNHLPAHLLLVNHLLREHQAREDTQLILPELKLLCDKFPFQTEEVLKYCQDSDLADLLEDSFEETEDTKNISRFEEKTTIYREVLTAVVHCLDYPVQPANVQIWRFFVESLKFLDSRHQENEEYVRRLFESKCDWWLRQNFTIDNMTKVETLVKKSIVSLILLGAESDEYRITDRSISERRENNLSLELEVLLKEREFVRSKNTEPFLVEVKKSQIIDDDNFVKMELKKIKRSKKRTNNT